MRSIIARIKRNVLGIIPARGCFKGIQEKNIKLILGKPLSVWSIESAAEQVIKKIKSKGQVVRNYIT